jgi:MoaA/NifB/PqqE/SkfB family radical SAM enzyme
MLDLRAKGVSTSNDSGIGKSPSGINCLSAGDEEQYGGCLAAGRGFIHVNPRGQLEACPFAPFSDTDLSEISLREALGSELLLKIRQNASQLSETKGGALYGKIANGFNV